MDYSSNYYGHGYGSTSYPSGYQQQQQQQQQQQYSQGQHQQQQYPPQSQYPQYSQQHQYQQPQYQQPQGYEHYSQMTGYPQRQPSFGPQDSCSQDSYSQYSHDTLSQYSGKSRPKTEYDYDKIETTDRGIKDYFMTSSFDEYGMEQSRVSKSKFVAALALGGAALYAAKKGYQQYQDKKMMQQIHEEGPSYPPDVKSEHGSQFGYN
ncbi:hypothetical protein IWW50_006532 [Coemansia erecta]|nr:hypothetical protein IWW50_006532 [Coemansia erecta]